MNTSTKIAVVCLTVLSFIIASSASIITFDAPPTDPFSYTVDADGDGTDDVLFSTDMPGGLSRLYLYSSTNIDGYALMEGISNDQEELRVDFLAGAQDYISFDFLINSRVEYDDLWATFEIFNSSDMLLASSMESGKVDGLSQYTEGQISATFSGTASYAIFNFNCPDIINQNELFLLDNVAGSFGSSEVTQIPDPPQSVPEPQITVMFAVGLISLAGIAGRKKS